YHVVSADGDVVNGLQPITKAGIWINGGFFVFRKDIFDYMQDGEELVEQPFQRLIEQQQLVAYKYDGYWACMDTFKDKQQLEDLYTRGEAPWELWKSGNNGRPRPAQRLNGAFAAAGADASRVKDSPRRAASRKQGIAHHA